MIGNYNFSDEQQLNLFIIDLKGERPDDDSRNNLLDDLLKHINDTTEQSEEFESTIDSYCNEVNDLEEQIGHLNDELDELTKENSKIEDELFELKNSKQ